MAAGFVAVITPLQIERDALRPWRQLRLSTSDVVPVRFFVSGIGLSRARCAAVRASDAGARILVCAGFAAALCEDLAAGTLVVPAHCASFNRSFEIDRALFERFADALAGPRTGASEALDDDLDISGRKLVCVSEILSNGDDKARLAEQTGAHLADMESAAVAEVAASGNLPFAILRCVSDAVSTPMPAYLSDVMSSTGSLRLTKLARAIAANPRSIADLREVQRGAAKARRRLRRGAKCLDQA